MEIFDFFRVGIVAALLLEPVQVITAVRLLAVIKPLAMVWGARNKHVLGSKPTERQGAL